MIYREFHGHSYVPLVDAIRIRNLDTEIIQHQVLDPGSHEGRFASEESFSAFRKTVTDRDGRYRRELSSER
jgi:hypothetical protein